MKYRKLRIAFSAGCGVLCLLLIGLWVRSYWRQDNIFVLPSRSVLVGVTSIEGRLELFHDTSFSGYSKVVWWQPNKFTQFLTTGYPDDAGQYPNSNRFQVFHWKGHGYTELHIPMWFPLLVSASFATAPWLTLRFSLRTLLIAMTLVAVALGLIIALSR